jgi:MFS transporter, ACS family, pantothenate transporter
MNASKKVGSGSDATNEDSSLSMRDQLGRSKWARVQDIVWDGPRTKEEKKLVQRLDIFLM